VDDYDVTSLEEISSHDFPGRFCQTYESKKHNNPTRKIPKLGMTTIKIPPDQVLLCVFLGSKYLQNKMLGRLLGCPAGTYSNDP